MTELSQPDLPKSPEMGIQDLRQLHTELLAAMRVLAADVKGGHHHQLMHKTQALLKKEEKMAFALRQRHGRKGLRPEDYFSPVDYERYMNYNKTLDMVGGFGENLQPVNAVKTKVAAFTSALTKARRQAAIREEAEAEAATRPNHCPETVPLGYGEGLKTTMYGGNPDAAIEVKGGSDELDAAMDAFDAHFAHEHHRRQRHHPRPSG